MGRPVKGVAGGIIALLALPDEVWGAFEADLARWGWSIDDIPSRLNWRTVWSLFKNRKHDDAVNFAIDAMNETKRQASLKQDIHDTIAAAKALGWGVD